VSANTPVTFPGEVFADTADFDQGTRLLLPRYDEMLEAIAHGLPETAEQILELGCGTGELSLKVLERCPQAHLVAVDYSPRMLTAAQAKLEAAGYGERVTWVEADFGDWAMGNRELLSSPAIQGPAIKLDACVSSLAIHHLSHDLKLKLFQRIHQGLQAGGCFWNADPTPPEAAQLVAAYQALREAWTAQQDTSLEAVRAKMGSGDTHGHSSHDHLESLQAHLSLLTQAGFHALEVPWKYYGQAVFGGFV
jgi:tRNA (cmo5U34)-methyltransferase